MVGANFMDEMDCGIFFDHIDDLLEFPNYDVENALVGKGGCDEFSPLWPENSMDSELPGSESIFSGANNSVSDLSAELSVPYEDIIHLEWLSTFVEDSFSGGGLTLEKSQSSSSTTTTKQSQFFQNQFQSPSPISVLESSSNCTTTTNNINNRKRARSKRPRPTAFTPRLAIHLTSPTSSESESSLHPHKKKQKIKFLPPMNNQNQNPPSLSQAVRKCMHCEITKTPQWRVGPMGPKTLCNACGVRYKSGRLFPEYRPAASPTFVPALHSNSHKKVVEMRSKNNGENSEMPM